MRSWSSCTTWSASATREMVSFLATALHSCCLISHKGQCTVNHASWIVHDFVASLAVVSFIEALEAAGPPAGDELASRRHHRELATNLRNPRSIQNYRRSTVSSASPSGLAAGVIVDHFGYSAVISRRRCRRGRGLDRLRLSDTGNCRTGDAIAVVLSLELARFGRGVLTTVWLPIQGLSDACRPNTSHGPSAAGI